MVIAVDSRILFYGDVKNGAYFFHKVFERLCASNPEHQFYFLFDRPYSKSFSRQNANYVNVSPRCKNILTSKYWYDVKLPAILKKIHADVFVGTNGFLSARTKLPQYLIVHNDDVLNNVDGHKKIFSIFYRKAVSKFLKTAERVAVVSEVLEECIVEQYKIPAEKVDVIYNAPKDFFVSLNMSDQSEVKERYTEGREFFLCIADKHTAENLFNLLKAFSIFKKRQQSEMKLVLQVGKNHSNEVIQSLKTYKYRNDVVIINNEDAAARLMASSYAFIYPPVSKVLSVHVLEAMKCGVPVLTLATENEVENAVLNFRSHAPDDIADKLMLIYKDENLRRQLIEKGKTHALKYNWNRTSDLLWKSILKTTSGFK